LATRGETFIEQVHYVPVEYPVQRPEIEALLERERVPAKLRPTAVYAAMGINQEDSGKLQGCPSICRQCLAGWAGMRQAVIL